MKKWVDSTPPIARVTPGAHPGRDAKSYPDLVLCLRFPFPAIADTRGSDTLGRLYLWVYLWSIYLDLVGLMDPWVVDPWIHGSVIFVTMYYVVGG